MATPLSYTDTIADVSWEFRDSSHGVAYRRGSTMVTMGPARIMPTETPRFT
jgi:hypothetical protein